MAYWLDLFTGTTWRQFREAGARVSGFSHARRGVVARIKSGDILLCYMTGVMRWVGALEVVGPSHDSTAIWGDGEFPVRLSVSPIVLLEPEHGVPMTDLVGRVAFYASATDAGKFRGFVRSSPAAFARDTDGPLILDLLQRAKVAPIIRPVDQKKLSYRPLFKVKRRTGGHSVERIVSVPDKELTLPGADGALASDDEPRIGTTRHTEVQSKLAEMGAGMGLDIWIARNDRSRTWQGTPLGALPRVIDQMPTQFNEATQRTIELIDVLWLRGNSILAAFEIECTTSVYSGLLRMSDLLALQPNIDIRLYIVAPDERREKVEIEMRRPSFALGPKPLAGACGFIALSRLIEQIEGIRRLRLSSSLSPDFLETIAEYFGAS